MKVHDLAVHICKREKGKISLPVGQVKEVIRLLAIVFAEEFVDGDNNSFDHFMKYSDSFVKKVKRNHLTK